MPLSGLFPNISKTCYVIDGNNLASNEWIVIFYAALLNTICLIVGFYIIKYIIG